MKNRFVSILGAVVLLLAGQRSLAADPTTELNALIAKINTDTLSGKRTEETLADDIKQFDALLAEHKGEKTEAVAEILYMKAVLYDQIITNHVKGKELFKQFKAEFNGTPIVEEYTEREAAEKINAALVLGAKFPDFNEKDLDGKPLSVAGQNGRLVLVDFWATWCMPCRVDLPNVIAAYQKYHNQGFDIVGVSLDTDRTNMMSFIKDQNMTWPEFFDGLKWSNKLAVKYGVQGIPANFLLDGSGKIIGRDLHGDDLQKAIAAALPKK